MNVKLPDKLPVTFNKKNLVKKVAKKGDCTAYLEHHLGDKVMRVLAQLGTHTYNKMNYFSFILLINFYFILKRI